jgi:hypothetical protein
MFYYFVQDFFTDPDLKDNLKELEKDNDKTFEINKLIQNFK